MDRQLLIFSDLDGTLLDEHYRYDAAATALARIRDAGIPLVLTSSKTLPEMRALRSMLGLHHPVIFENGAGIATPVGYFEGERNPAARLEIETFGPGYHEIRRVLDELRTRHRYPFRGFGDMTAAEVARHTGLDEVAAQRARQRHGTEPGIWTGSRAIREDFERDVARTGLRLVAGGRFLHLMPRADKATAMEALVARYRTAAPGRRPLVVAAGDSPNDADMLAAADIAVVVRRTDGSCMPLRRREGVLRTEAVGPAGWQQRVLEILDRRGC